MKDLTIRELQTRLPWTIKYSSDFRSNPASHKDFAHSLLHVGKALGKLLEFVDDMDHDKDKVLDKSNKENYQKYIADLVICALRAANTFPGSMIDLQRSVEDRIENKNDVKLVRDHISAGDRVQSEALQTYIQAIDFAGFRIGADVINKPRLWCKECSNSDGHHWSKCSKYYPKTHEQKVNIDLIEMYRQACDNAGLRVVVAGDGKATFFSKDPNKDIEVKWLSQEAVKSVNCAKHRGQSRCDCNDGAQTVNSALNSAGMRLGFDIHNAPTIFCNDCGRDSGFHWAKCTKLQESST